MHQRWIFAFCVALSLLCVGALTVSLTFTETTRNKSNSLVQDTTQKQPERIVSSSRAGEEIRPFRTPIAREQTRSILVAPVSPKHELSPYLQGYKEGFKDALVTAALASLAGACASVLLLLIGACAWRAASRITRIHSALPLLLIAGIFLSGCVAKTSRSVTATQPAQALATAKASDTEPTVLMPPLAEVTKTPLNGTTISVPQPNASPATRTDDPEVLRDLLDMKGTTSKNNSAVKALRPSAIREAAHMVTLQTAIAWRYGQLLDAVYQHSAIMDSAFNFAPLVMTQDDALILPPVLARAGASMRIEENNTATAASSTFELLQNAKYISVVPHWRTYLMADNFPQPEAPNPSVLPKNNEERAIWQEAVREAWAQGTEEADQLFADNVARMVRDYRGVMLYHLLTAQHLISEVKTAHADLGMNITNSGNRLNIGQRVFRITDPSAFVVPKPTSQKKSSTKRGR